MGDNNVFVATEVFEEVLHGAKVIKVDPAACVPYISVRDLVDSGVLRLKHSFDKTSENVFLSGAISGGFLPTVVELSGPLRSWAVKYFEDSLMMDHESAVNRVESRKSWYGVIDGAHRLHALLHLQEERPDRWQGFQWTVLLLARGHNFQVLRAFARSQNLLQSDDNFVETTVYDLLKGMQDEIPLLTAQFGGRTPTAKELAEGFSGGRGRTTSSLRALANLSLRLSPRVVHIIGVIINFESPNLACTFYAGKGRTELTADTISQHVDCRVYRSFLTITALKQATVFMHEKGDRADTIRIHTLQRLRELCRLNGFRPVTFRTVNEQYAKAKAALMEAEKFERLLESTNWPRGMETLKRNLLSTTVLDEEVATNAGNETDVLPEILTQFRRCCANFAPLLEAKYHALVSRSAGHKEKTSIPHTNEITRSGERATLERDCAEGKKLSSQDTPAPGDDSNKTNERETDFYRLAQMGISVFNMSWQEYEKSFRPATDTLFDMILTEPPKGARRSGTLTRNEERGLDSKEMLAFAAFARRFVVPGGYIIVITQFPHFNEWVRAFRANDMVTVNYPFVIAHENNSVISNNQLMFPQSACDFAVMVLNPGKHPQGFKPDYKTKYTLLPCTYKRKLAIVDNVPSVRKKLKFKDSRAVLRPDEKHPDLLGELLVTFSMQNARVLDPFAGTLSTAQACISTGRKCALVEKDKNCFEISLERLLLMCRIHATSPALRLRARRAQRMENSGSSSTEESFQSGPVEGPSADKEKKSDDNGCVSESDDPEVSDDPNVSSTSTEAKEACDTQ